ncbi:MAG: hypothetical protein K8S98_05350 [Planctomycetes bacterium]|nr:hypothetical protein [Planctomycetota bacterium]
MFVRPILRLVCLTLTSFVAATAAHAQTHKQQDGAIETLADSAPARAWSSWAAEHGARVESLGGGRILFVAPAQRTGLDETRRAVAATVARFDEVLGKSDGAATPVVLLDLDDRAGFGAAMDELANQNPYAAPWLRSIAAAPRDFVLEEPVVGALAFFAGEKEEWDPVNELVHRCAHLLLVQRFGHQPHWLRVGLCWTIEQDVRGTIYCFPGRNDFVSIADHDGWSSELTALYKPKSVRTLSIADLATLSREHYDSTSAARAWGAARFLVEHEHDALPKILGDLRDAWIDGSRETHADGTWVQKPDFELDATVQTRVFEKHAGADVWKRLTDAFRDARRLRSTKGKPPVEPTRH